MASTSAARQLKPGEGETINVVTDRVRILADGASTGGRCSIFDIVSEPGMGPPLHRHGVDDEFFVIVEGRFKFVRDGAEFIAEPGAFVACPKNSVHTFVCLGPKPGRMIVTTTPAGLEAPFRDAHAAAQRGPLSPEVLAPIFAKFNLEFMGPPLGA